MSSGPTLTGENCIQAIKRDYVNLELTKKSWCIYEEGVCHKDDVLSCDINLCLLCKYRKPLDIPMRIRYRRNVKARVNYGKSLYEGE